MSVRLENIREIEDLFNRNILLGREFNNAVKFTVTVSAATTTVFCPWVYTGCTWTLTPITASAAGEADGSTYITESGIDEANRQITVNHPNNATADREWVIHIWGKAIEG